MTVSCPHNTQKENDSRCKFRFFDTGDVGPVHFSDCPNILIHIFDNKLYYQIAFLNCFFLLPVIFF